MKRILWIVVAVLGVMACQPEKELYLSTEERDAFEAMINPAILNIAFIKNNDIYLYRDAEKGSIRLTTDSAVLKFMPRISHDGLKIAYIHQNGYPIVINALTGDTIRSYPQFAGVTCYDWIAGPLGANDVSLYMLINDSIKFTSASLTVPNLPLNAATEVKQVAFDPAGNYYYLATEERPNGDITRLYRWEKSTGLIKEMIFDEPVAQPNTARLSISGEGDILLALAQDPGNAVYNTFYAFDKGSLRVSVKEKSVKFNTARYNSKLKQALVYGVEPFGTFAKFIRLNYQPFQRAVDKNLDTTKYGNLIIDFDWK
ncbi:MAG TPA: hypothetical protein VFV37_02545 [Luteibaculaceae bacterium]|nr:hypothetical protein [Luteibaculaceae bacterium]